MSCARKLFNTCMGARSYMNRLSHLSMDFGFNNLWLKFGKNPFMESRATNITVKWSTHPPVTEGKATYSQDQFYERVLQKLKKLEIGPFHLEL